MRAGRQSGGGGGRQKRQTPLCALSTAPLSPLPLRHAPLSAGHYEAPHIASWRNTVEIHLLFPPTNHGKVAARTVLVAAFDALCIKSGVLYLDLDRSGGRGQVEAVFAKARTVGGASWAAWAAPWGRAGAGEKTRHGQKLGAPRGASGVGIWRRRAVGGGGGEKKGGGWHFSALVAVGGTPPGPPGRLQVHPPGYPYQHRCSTHLTERQHASDAVDTSI